MKFLRFLFPLVTIGLVVLAMFAVLSRSHSHTIPIPPTTQPLPQAAQIWELTEQQTLQKVRIMIKPFTYSGDFIETSDSPGWWVYGTQGEKVCQLHVNGNIVFDNPNDRLDFVNFGGAGAGFTVSGSGEGSLVGKYPNATSASGTAKMQIISPLGTDYQNITWIGRRIK